MASNGFSNGVYRNGHDIILTNGQSKAANGFPGLNGTNQNGRIKRHSTTEVENEPEIKRSKDRGFLESMIQLMMTKCVDEVVKGETKVIEFVHPKELEQRLKLGVSENPCSDEKIISMCRDIIKYSVKTGHPHFYNQLFGGFNAHGLGGAWLTEAINASQYTYEVAPVFTLMEKAVLGEMLKLIGFPDGDAIFCPGGSLSNMYAINLARYRKFPQAKESGLFGLPNLCIMTSEKSHYSTKKGAAFLGFGMNNVIPVDCDAVGRMIPEKLEESLKQAKAKGSVPLMVVATAGTTVLGAYDPINDIADICERYNIWLHVDACWGGGVMLSPKLRCKMAGVHRADSVAWNAHKMMAAPLQCCGFFTRHKTLLSEAHSAKAKYLFQQDKFYDVSYDTGDKSIQCGRKVDVLKLWMIWKAKGTKQYGLDVENMFECANYLAKKLSETDGFRLVIQEPECTNVTFWYIPPSMRGQKETTEWWDRLAKVAPSIKKGMVECGSMLIGYQPDGDLPNFFRMVITHLDVTHADMDFVVSEIDRLGRNL